MAGHGFPSLLSIESSLNNCFSSIRGSIKLDKDFILLFLTPNCSAFSGLMILFFICAFAEITVNINNKDKINEMK